MTDPLDLDAVDQAALVRTGQVGARELVEGAIRRIEARNGSINAVIHERFDAALDEADRAADGPFRGVPIVVKNALGSIAGEPYHLGMRALAEAGHRATHDSELVRRYRAAGFVVIGATNTPELALSTTTEPIAYGATRNPWDPARSTGGSSGGSAAAVASGMVAVAHGNDMGGSIRIPAAWCGLFGLKPTYGRTTLGPDFGEYWGQSSHEHVVARSVRDSAAVLDAVHGPLPGDPSPAPPPPGPFVDATTGPHRRLRIGIVRTMPFVGEEPDVAVSAPVDRAIGLLAEAGHDLVEVGNGPLDDPGNDLGGDVVTVHAASELLRIGKLLGRELTDGDVEPWTWALASAGRQVSAAAHTLVQHRIHRFRRNLELWRGGNGYDALLTPVTGVVAPPLGIAGGAQPFEEVLRVVLPACAYTQPFNLVGWPAASVPMGVDDGMPAAVQVVGAYGDEHTVIAVAGELESASPWPHFPPAFTPR